MKLYATPEFRKWQANLNENYRAQLKDRLDKIRNEDHFGTMKHLGDGLFELKWHNGMRTYLGFVEREGRVVLLLLGGFKNGQDRDIEKARALLGRESS